MAKRMGKLTQINNKFPAHGYSVILTKREAEKRYLAAMHDHTQHTKAKT